MVEYDIQKRKENLKNIKKVVAKFEARLNIEVRQQEKLEMAEKRYFRREELLEKYITKMLYK